MLVVKVIKVIKELVLEGLALKVKVHRVARELASVVLELEAKTKVAWEAVPVEVVVVAEVKTKVDLEASEEVL